MYWCRRASSKDRMIEPVKIKDWSKTIKVETGERNSKQTSRHKCRISIVENKTRPQFRPEERYRCMCEVDEIIVESGLRWTEG